MIVPPSHGSTWLSNSFLVIFSLFFFGSHLHMYMNRLVQYIYACGSVLGMYLFGGKFCMRDDGSGSCTCEEILRRDPGCICDRKHFNTLLWATVTVFQASSWRTRTTKFRHTPQHRKPPVWPFNFRRISCPCSPFDSSFNDLSMFYWVQIHLIVSFTANQW